MKISDMIERLEHIKEAYGDLPVNIRYMDNEGLYTGDQECEFITVVLHAEQYSYKRYEEFFVEHQPNAEDNYVLLE